MYSNYLIYLLECPKSGNCYYVGTTNAWESRRDKHLSGSDKTTGKWVRSLTKKGLKPIFKPVVYNLSKSDALQLEKRLINNDFSSPYLLNKQHNPHYVTNASLPQKVYSRILKLFQALR